MAIELPNNKISRTLPEQVGFNSVMIEKIIKFLNESGLKDQVINLTSLSGTLTPEQYAIAELSPSYIVYEGTIFFKGIEDLTNIDYFELTPKIETDSSMLLNMSRIRIVRDTRAYSQSYVNLFESYNKTQLDNLLAAKADLSGANFTGNVNVAANFTADSIIENMVGYSFQQTIASENLTVTNVFVGISKTGNKLTIVHYFKAVRPTGASSATVRVGRFNIPSSVGEKLIGETISGYSNVLDMRVEKISSGLNFGVEAIITVQKQTNSYFDFLLTTTNMVAETTYNVRIERTFLLTDNFVS